MGHVVRCLALADYLKEYHSCNIHFAMRQSELGIDKVVESFPVLQTNEIDFNYKEWLIDCITQTKSETLIMDMRDGLTKEDLKLVKKRTGIKVVTIDDPEDKRLESDLAFYPPVPQLMKTNWDGFEGELYIGWEYVIVRKEFLHKYPKRDNLIPNILVSMGGTDEKNMTKFVVNTLNEIKEEFKAIIIVGAGYPYLKQLNYFLDEVQFENELYQNPANIAEIMSKTDFAIISFGQTAYELVALKVPVIYLCLTKDHGESAQLFEKERVGKSLGIYPINKEHLIEKVSNYLIEYGSIANLECNVSLLNISLFNKISQSIFDEFQ